MSNADTTGGVKPEPPDRTAAMGAATEGGTLRQRAERRLWELEAMAELMAADLGPATARGRLLACRWAAARALLLEVLEQYQPSPATWHAIGSPFDQAEESGLLGRLCQRHGWQCVSPGHLVRRGGRGHG